MRAQGAFSEQDCEACAALASAIRHVRGRFPEHVAVVWKLVAANDSPTAAADLRRAYCTATAASFVDTASVASGFPYSFFHGASPNPSWSEQSTADPSLDRCFHAVETTHAVGAAEQEAGAMQIQKLPVLLINGRMLPGIPTKNELELMIASEFPSRRR